MGQGVNQRINPLDMPAPPDFSKPGDPGVVNQPGGQPDPTRGGSTPGSGWSEVGGTNIPGLIMEMRRIVGGQDPWSTLWYGKQQLGSTTGWYAPGFVRSTKDPHQFYYYGPGTEQPMSQPGGRLGRELTKEGLFPQTNWQLLREAAHGQLQFDPATGRMHAPLIFNRRGKQLTGPQWSDYESFASGLTFDPKDPNRTSFDPSDPRYWYSFSDPAASEQLQRLNTLGQELAAKRAARKKRA